MSPRRRALLAALSGPLSGPLTGPLGLTMPARAQMPSAPAASRGTPPMADEDSIRPERHLQFPRDHGAHSGARIEWWYATGWLQPPGQAAPIGWQLTFFRSRTGLAATLPGRFAPRQLLFAHAAISDIAAGRHSHAQRLSRWSGDERWPEAHAQRADTGVVLGPWQLRRDAASGRYQARLPAPEAGFALDLALQPTQPVLLQGQAGFSRKGPLPAQASHYYSLPHLAVTAQLLRGSRRQTLTGSGWLDHEWSDELMPADAAGWDWIGINLHDGGALTAFVLRRRDGSVVWAGGSHRPAGGAVRAFPAGEVSFTPQREWTSPKSGARYPVKWAIVTPVGAFQLEALLDNQELDSSASTGAVYWEGLAALQDSGGRRVGLGYLEMTGRVAPLRLG
ncbi:carotenoid 1,2-hydratase [Aquabacterium sp.]|uniref:lipocalin-like domain-containing protein n=1 Tax=Aquabacterium sp. TaxID=1872578 RepID=UPI002BE60369|nr:carotenoid 1,2-hydratase [Aquabacterium sp.]HSW08666.1 carotenoid 1,2-hydratase [Aquabacterium sp.]